MTTPRTRTREDLEREIADLYQQFDDADEDDAILIIGLRKMIEEAEEELRTME